MAKKEINIDELVGNEDTQLKQPTQKETKVKNQSNKKTIIVTVVSTLAVIAAIIAIFYAGVQYEQGRQNTIVQEATKLTQQLKDQKQ